MKCKQQICTHKLKKAKSSDSKHLFFKKKIEIEFAQEQGLHFGLPPPHLCHQVLGLMKFLRSNRKTRAMRTLCIGLLTCAFVASACAAGAVGSSPSVRQGRAGTVLQGQHVMKGARTLALRGGAPLDEVRWV
jgi:hypothetical protein